MNKIDTKDPNDGKHCSGLGFKTRRVLNPDAGWPWGCQGGGGGRFVIGGNNKNIH
jgi:hypothetical protein